MTTRLPSPFSLQSFFLAVVLLCSNNSGGKTGRHSFMVTAQTTPTTGSQLPPGLQNTDVSYEETRGTYVPFPAESQHLLYEELAALKVPLTLEVFTTITHWKNPVWHLLRGLIHRMRAQNQIIYIHSHYHVSTGLQEGCRTKVLVDATTGQEEEMAVDTDACRQMCTNHGRYCAPLLLPTQQQELQQQQQQPSPKVIVEETLRRLCIGELYHDTDLRHWDYLDAFEKLQCHLQGDMAMCAQQAMAQTKMDWNQVEACMEAAGGLEADTINVRLQEQVDRQQEQNYSLQDMPQIMMEGEAYKGPWDVEHLLASVCRAFPEDLMTPLACQFCEPCLDARKCLWYLECDGAPFDVAQIVTSNIYQIITTPVVTSPTTALNTDAIVTSPPTALNTNATRGDPIDILAQSETTHETAASSTTQPPPSSIPQPSEAPDPKPEDGLTTLEAYFDDDKEPDQNDSNYSDEEDQQTHGYFVGGILAGLIAGGAPAIWFIRDEKAMRKRINKIRTERAAAAEEVDWEAASPQQRRYKDNEDAGVDSNGSSDGIDDGDDLHDDFDDFLDQSNRSEDIIIRPTAEELEELEDVDLATNQNNGHSSRPPRMSFKLHQFIK